MNLKPITFDIELLSTKSQTSDTTIMTNDYQSAELVFNIKDHDKVDLPSATVDVLLYMRDGSFFQNEGAGFIKENSIRYVLKPNEGKHAGMAKVQLIVKSGGVRYATGFYEFDIQTGLNDRHTVTEIVITNWDQLVREAQGYITKFVADEADRRELFETNELNREIKFTTNENNRQKNEVVRIDQETTRVTAENNRELNESGRVSAENVRVSNEGDRVNSESIRVEFYEGFDGRLVGLESDKVVLKNLVENGDEHVAVQSLYNNTPPTHYTSKDVIDGHIYYLSLNAKKIDDTHDTLVFGWSHVNYIYNNNRIHIIGPGLSESGENFTFVFEGVSGTAPRNILFSGFSGKNAHADVWDVQILDLTETFGAGNEPTKAEMDELIKITGYFDEITLTQKQLLNWLLKLKH